MVMRHAEHLRGVIGVKSVIRAAHSGHARSRGRFAHEASEGGEIEPDIGLKDKRLNAWQAKERHAFEVPVFKSGVARLDGVPSAMIEFLPGGRADGDIPHQANGFVLEAFSDVANLAMRMRSGLIRAFRRWVGDVGEPNDRVNAM